MNEESEVVEDEEVVPDNIIQFPIHYTYECPGCRGRGMVTAFIGKLKGEHFCVRCSGSGKIGNG